MSTINKKLTGWRYAAFLGGFLGLLGAALYPIAIYPMYNSEPYKNIQKVSRAGIKQEEIQPGNMKVWTDPFDRRKEERK